MKEESINIKLTKAEAIVLLEFLTRFNKMQGLTYLKTKQNKEFYGMLNVF